jgi:hypothetical protein
MPKRNRHNPPVIRNTSIRIAIKHITIEAFCFQGGSAMRRRIIYKKLYKGRSVNSPVEVAKKLYNSA